MKQFITGMLAAALSFVLLGSSNGAARAADLPVKAPPAPAIYNWSGFYAGGTFGYGWRDNRATTFAQADPLVTAVTCGGVLGGTCAPPASSGLSGGVFGIQAGYNWQFASRWLLGFETDINFTSISGSATSAPYRIALVDAQNNVDQNIDWFGTVRARLGFLATDRLLVYGTGGFAYAQVREGTTLTALTEQGANGLGSAFGCQAATNSAPTCFVGSSSRTATGWTAGGGLEYALWDNFSLKAEYLYVNLGRGSVNVVALDNSVFGPGITKASFTAAFDRPDLNIVRVGFNYKFGAP